MLEECAQRTAELETAARAEPPARAKVAALQHVVASRRLSRVPGGSQSEWHRWRLPSSSISATSEGPWDGTLILRGGCWSGVGTRSSRAERAPSSWLRSEGTLLACSGLMRLRLVALVPGARFVLRQTSAVWCGSLDYTRRPRSLSCLCSLSPFRGLWNLIVHFVNPPRLRDHHFDDEVHDLEQAGRQSPYRRADQSRRGGPHVASHSSALG